MAPAPKSPTEHQKKYQLIFDQVHILSRQGVSLRSIARQQDISKNTVRRYLRYDHYPGRQHALRGVSKCEPYADFLQQQWEQGEHRVNHLFAEIRQRGYTGGLSSVYRFIKRYPQAEGEPKELRIRPWSPRKMSRLLTKDRRTLSAADRRYLHIFLNMCSPAGKARQLARQFQRMVKDRSPHKLDAWLKAVDRGGIPSLRSFGRGIKRDYDAVTAALSLPWSNGPVEGYINRLKTIKRKLYGRASFSLLRKCVLFDSG